MLSAIAVASALTGPAVAGHAPAHVEVEFLRAEFEPAPMLIEMKSDDGQIAYVAHDPLLTNIDVASAGAEVDGVTGQNEIRVTFTEEGKEAFAAVTAESVGKPIAITLDYKLVAAPKIMAPITSGEAVITGNFTLVEAQRIAAGIVTAQK